MRAEKVAKQNCDLAPGEQTPQHGALTRRASPVRRSN